MVDFIVVYSSFHLICAIQWCFPWGGRRAGTHTHRGQKSRLMFNATTEWKSFNHDYKQRTRIKLELSEINVNSGKLTPFWSRSSAKYVLKKWTENYLTGNASLPEQIWMWTQTRPEKKISFYWFFFKSHWCKNKVYIIYSFSATSTMPNLIIVW